MMSLLLFVMFVVHITLHMLQVRAPLVLSALEGREDVTLVFL